MDELDLKNPLVLRTYLEELFPPTRLCLMCECKENPDSQIVAVNKAWVCDKCREAFKRVVENAFIGKESGDG